MLLGVAFQTNHIKCVWWKQRSIPVRWRNKSRIHLRKLFWEMKMDLYSKNLFSSQFHLLMSLYIKNCNTIHLKAFSKDYLKIIKKTKDYWKAQVPFALLASYVAIWEIGLGWGGGLSLKSESWILCLYRPQWLASCSHA